MFAAFTAFGSTTLPESPRFLYDKGEFAHAKAVIFKMARMNGSKTLSTQWRFDTETEVFLHSNLDKTGKSSSYLIVNPHQILKFTLIGSIANTKLEEKLINNKVMDIAVKEAEVKLHPVQMMKLNPRLFINLCIVATAWVSLSFNYFLISFDIKNLGGNMFLNSSLISLAGITGKFTVYMLKKRLPTKTTMLCCFTLIYVFGFGLVFLKADWMISVCIAFVEIGIGGSFTLCYYINTEYFPPLFLGYALAICQLCARGFTIFSFLLTDLQAPIPMVLL